MTRLRSSLLALVASTALAHRAPAKQDRLELRPGGIELTIVTSIDGEARRALFEQFDRDGSGRLENGEHRALETYLMARATRALSLVVDGKPIVLSFSETLTIDEVRIGLRVVGRSALLLSGAHHIRFLDGLPDPSAQVPVEVILRDVRAKVPAAVFVAPSMPLEIDVQP